MVRSGDLDQRYGQSTCRAHVDGAELYGSESEYGDRGSIHRSDHDAEFRHYG